MGLGKSLIMISLLARDWSATKVENYKTRQTLLVVPSVLLQTWTEEFNQHIEPNSLSCKLYYGANRHKDWHETANSDVVITTYNTVVIEWRDLNPWKKPLFLTKWYRLVLDEGQLYKSKQVAILKISQVMRSELAVPYERNLSARSRLIAAG